MNPRMDRKLAKAPRHGGGGQATRGGWRRAGGRRGGNQLQTGSSRFAFSLIELLVVIAILAIMAVAGSVALGDRKSVKARGGAEVLHSLFGQARTQAVMERERARVVLQGQNIANREEDYLRLAAIMVEDDSESSGWRRTSSWMRLPEGVFFHREKSQPDGTMSVEAAGGSVECDFYEFQPNGQRNGPAKVVVSEGEIAGGAFQERGEGGRHGFMVYPMGQRVFLSLSKMREAAAP